MQVLIADDDWVTRNMMHRALDGAGYDVITASDGQEALDALRAGSCQLVVSDWEMPRMTGLELCNAVGGGALGRYIYIIMLTSHDRPEDVLSGLNAGADDFVTKPFNPMEIIGRIRSGERMLALETAEMTIFAMAKLAESRDPETGAHLERVRSYCRVLAERLRQHPKYQQIIDDRFVHLIYQTSPLHDIGKVAIPDRVLLKPGRLDKDEFDIMKCHTAYGAATLDAAIAKYPNVGFLRMARDIALSHHEKWNGAGYPNGLAGEDIPLCGRIVALADVYDALVSKRVYKDAFTHASTRSIILDGRDEHFDPAVVDAFTTSERYFLEIREQYAVKLAAAA